MANHNRSRNRYREMESIMMKVLIGDGLIFFLYMFAASRVGVWSVIKVISVILKHECIPAIKEIMNIKGFDAGSVVYPGKRFTEEERKALIDDLIEAGYPINE